MPLIVVFLLLFISALAHCQNYSIGVASKSGAEQVVSFQILVNGVNAFEKTKDINVPEEADVLDWINFQAKPGDSIEVRFSADENDFDSYYIVNNGLDGSRIDIYDSRSDTFKPKNKCPETQTCSFKIANVLTEPWEGNRANVYINGQIIVSQFNGTDPSNFTARFNDEIKVIFSHETSSSPEIGYSILKLDEPIDYIEWFYNSYGSVALIDNPFSSVTIVECEEVVKAGEDLRIKLISFPEEKNYTVQLFCDNFDPVDRLISSNKSELFGIPEDLFGIDCVLSVERPIAGSNTNFLNVTQSVNILALNITQPANFIKSVDNAEYFFNSNVIVFLSSNINETFGYSGPTLYLQCSDMVIAYNDAPINQDFEVALPTNYIGSCSLYSTASGIYQVSTTNITIYSVKGYVSFDSALNQTTVVAGTEMQIALYSTPVSENFTVQLNCSIPNVSPVTSSIRSNPSIPQMFTIPLNYYGDNCVFSVIDPLNTFEPVNTLQVIIKQSATISKPFQGSSYLYNSQITAQLTSWFQSSTPLTFMQTCGSNTTLYENVTINTDFNVLPPFNYTGPCTFASLENGLYTASTTNVTVNIYGTAQTLQPTDQTYINANSKTPIKIISLPKQSVFLVDLDCFIPGISSKSQMILSNSDDQTFDIPSNFYGNCTFTVNSPDTNSKALNYAKNSFSNFHSVNVVITQKTLSVTAPNNTTIITYGQAVALLVNTNDMTAIPYTISFSCTSGSYQITGLTTGVTYNLVPAGIYGTVVVTATATSANPGTMSFSIVKPVADIPPAFIPGRLCYIPSVYANMKDGKYLEIVEVRYVPLNISKKF